MPKYPLTAIYRECYVYQISYICISFCNKKSRVSSHSKSFLWIREDEHQQSDSRDFCWAKMCFFLAFEFFFQNSKTGTWIFVILVVEFPGILNNKYSKISRKCPTISVVHIQLPRCKGNLRTYCALTSIWYLFVHSVRIFVLPFTHPNRNLLCTYLLCIPKMDGHQTTDCRCCLFTNLVNGKKKIPTSMLWAKFVVYIAESAATVKEWKAAYREFINNNRQMNLWLGWSTSNAYTYKHKHTHTRRESIREKERQRVGQKRVRLDKEHNDNNRTPTGWSNSFWMLAIQLSNRFRSVRSVKNPHGYWKIVGNARIVFSSQVFRSKSLFGKLCDLHLYSNVECFVEMCTDRSVVKLAD